MKPVLYLSTETTFSHNGLGTLSDCTSCIVTEERNGIYDLEMDYPVSGAHFSEVENGSLIKAVPSDGATPQIFEVYEITKPMNGICTVLANHISYRLSFIPCKPFSASSAGQAMASFAPNAAESCPFTFWTNLGTVANYSQTAPASIRSRLGGTEGSILDVYGGEFEFDNFTVKLHRSRGSDNGVTLRYGKNLTDLTDTESMEDVANGAFPFWEGVVRDDSGNETDVLVTLPEFVIHADGSESPYRRTIPLDLSGEWQDPPTVEQLRTRATAYVNANMKGLPKSNIKVSFVALWQTEEYKNVAALERVKLCDTVTVHHERLGISTSTKVVKTVYNVLLEKYDSIELGEVKANFASSLVSVAGSAQEANAAAGNALSAASGASYAAGYAYNAATAASSTANAAASTAQGAVNTANAANDKATLAGNTANKAAQRVEVAMEQTQTALDRANAAVAEAEQASQTAQSIAGDIDNRIQQKIDNATDLITGGQGGFIIIGRNANGEPEEIFIMDTDDTSTATNVIRMNKNGIGFSTNGVGGPYRNAWTIDGNLSADYITAGTLDAALVNVTHLNAGSIAAGTIDASQIAVVNLDASNITTGTLNAANVGIINLSAGSITAGTLDASRVNVVNLNANNITAGAIDASVIGVTNLNASNINTGVLNVRNSTTGYYTKIDTGTGKLEWNAANSSMDSNGTLQGKNVKLTGEFSNQLISALDGSVYSEVSINGGGVSWSRGNGSDAYALIWGANDLGEKELFVESDTTVRLSAGRLTGSESYVKVKKGKLPECGGDGYILGTQTVYGIPFINGLFARGPYHSGEEIPDLDLSGATRTLFANAGINMVIKDGIVKSCSTGKIRTSGSFTVSGTTYYIRDGLICSS